MVGGMRLVHGMPGPILILSCKVSKRMWRRRMNLERKSQIGRARDLWRMRKPWKLARGWGLMVRIQKNVSIHFSPAILGVRWSKVKTSVMRQNQSSRASYRSWWCQCCLTASHTLDRPVKLRKQLKCLLLKLSLQTRMWWKLQTSCHLPCGRSASSSGTSRRNTFNPREAQERPRPFKNQHKPHMIRTTSTKVGVEQHSRTEWLDVPNIHLALCTLQKQLSMGSFWSATSIFQGGCQVLCGLGMLWFLRLGIDGKVSRCQGFARSSASK